MRRWSKPYNDEETWFVGLVLAIEIAASVGAVLALGRGPHLIVIVYFWVVGVPGAVRWLMLGIQVSEYGIRSRTPLRTVTLRWAEVADIRNGTGTFLGLDTARAAIVIDRVDGRPVQTIVQRRERLSFFTRERGAIRTPLLPEPYDQLLSDLRSSLAAARRRDQPPPPFWVSVDGPVGAAAEAGSGIAGRYGAADVVGRPSAGTAGVAPAAGTVRTDPQVLSELHTLARLHERGVISAEELAAETAKVHERHSLSS